MRIVNKYMFIRNTAILLFIILAIFNISIAKSNKETSYIDYTVCKDDTVWNIAEEYKEDNKDIMQYIYKLKRLNNMTSSNIYEGQKIKIIKEQ